MDAILVEAVQRLRTLGVLHKGVNILLGVAVVRAGV